MSYEKQNWTEYDNALTEEENALRGSIILKHKLDHIEDGISAVSKEVDAVDATKIGLGNVENYGIASEEESVAGTAKDKYVTPFLVSEAIRNLQAIKSVNGRTGEITVTKGDVGLSNVDNVQQATKTDFTNHNNDGIRHITELERTSWSSKADGNHIHQASQIGGLQDELDKKLDATANAASATKLKNTRKISGKEFDGTEDIVLAAGDVGAVSLTGNETILGTKNFAQILMNGEPITGKAELENYVISRGQNLVTNGLGHLRNNTNFTGESAVVVFDGAERAVGVGSFRTATTTGIIRTSDNIPVNNSMVYEFSYLAKSKSAQSNVLVGVEPLDVDGLRIDPFTCAGRGPTSTGLPPIAKLTKPLKVGDTEAWFDNVSSFSNTGTSMDHYKSLIFWGYKNSLGYQYPVGTYSRLLFTQAWNVGDVDLVNKKITFRKPFAVVNPNSADGIFPIGHQVSPTNASNTYIYMKDAISIKFPTEFKKYSHLVGTVSSTGGVLDAQVNYIHEFAGMIGLVWLVNRDYPAGDTTWINGVSLSEIDWTTHDSIQKIIKKIGGI